MKYPHIVPEPYNRLSVRVYLCVCVSPCTKHIDTVPLHIYFDRSCLIVNLLLLSFSFSLSFSVMSPRFHWIVLSPLNLAVWLKFHEKGSHNYVEFNISSFALYHRNERQNENIDSVRYIHIYVSVHACQAKMSTIQ